ncbi:MAG: phosphoribosyltransferase family protein [Bacillus sp. (in: firmicutes)]
MKTTAPPLQETFHILDGFQVDVTVHSNPYGLSLHRLFQMAARINKKRSFLFVSKILGKHLAVPPQIPLAIGHLLAMRYKEVVHGKPDHRIRNICDALEANQSMTEILAKLEKEPIPLEQPTTIIGFAETATALGHAVFSAFESNVTYIHTTRENIPELSSRINFEEEHSHATSHRVYALDSEFLDGGQEIILVDDEITTGQTGLNIIRTLKAQYPAKNVFSIVSILDWRTAENRAKYARLEQELGITIHVVSLIEGAMGVKGSPALPSEKQADVSATKQELSLIHVSHYMDKDDFIPISSVSANGADNPSPYLKSTGRFGLTREEEQYFSRQCKELAGYLAARRKGAKTLVIGTGEFMYIPIRIAANMGAGIHYQSTTRSPIHQSKEATYTIRSKFTFDCPENNGIANHLYNIEHKQYDEIFIFVERLAEEKDINSLLEELQATGIPFIHVVVMTSIGGSTEC